MSRRLIAEIGKSQRITILETLKRRGSLTVRELSESLRMSYMGVKQLCIQMEKGGYLDTWRKPSTLGRPQMLYRLTTKAQELYERPDNHLSVGLLEASKKLFGPTAPEKILFQFYQTQLTTYAEKMRGDTPQDRARHFAKLRDEEGYVAELASEDGALHLIERHHPYLELIEKYPVCERMDTDMIQKLVGAPIRRSGETSGNAYRAVFTLLVR